jgi:hypothetical protein
MIKYEINEKRIISAFKNHTKIHLALTDKTFRNGIIKHLGAGFIILVDDVNGEEPIFIMEVRKVEPYMNKDEGR